MRRGLKVLFAVMLLILSGMFLVNHEVFATTDEVLVKKIDSSKSKLIATKQGKKLVQQFNGSGNAAKETTEEGETLIKKIVGPILSVVRIVAIGLGTIMITYLGIKYMSAAPSEKASIKTQLVTFTVGFAVVIGATTILQLINNVVSEITKS